MESDMRLVSLSVEAFRGFAIEGTSTSMHQSFCWWGPTEREETSFVDAVQWLLLGELDRLKEQKRRKTAEHIVNTHAAALGRDAVVRGDIEIQGQRVRASLGQGNRAALAS